MGIVTLIKWVFRLFRNPLTRGLGSKTISGIADSLLGRNGKDLPALLSKLTGGGLGEAVQSWVAKGKNQSIDADQVKSILGSDALSGIADRLGTSEDAAASKVARSLPQIIDELTPEGEVPDQKTISSKLAEILER